MINTIRTVEQTAVEMPMDPEVISLPDVAAEKVFSYMHGDGQEFSGTLDQAAKLCPVLGKMSVEDRSAVIEKADLMTRLAQRGREKRLSQEAKPNETKQPSREHTSADKRDLRDKTSFTKQDKAVTAESPFSSVEVDARIITTQPEPRIVPVVEVGLKDVIPGAMDDSRRRDLLVQQKDSETCDADVFPRHAQPIIAEAIAVAAPIHVTAYTERIPPVTQSVEVGRPEMTESIQPDAVILERPAALVQATRIVETVPEETTENVLPEVAPISIDEQEYAPSDEYVGPQAELPNLLEMPASFEVAETSEAVDGHGLINQADSVTPITESPSIEVAESVPVEYALAIQPPEIPVPVEIVETVITRLAEAVDISTTEDQTTAAHILEAIITLPTSLEHGSDESVEGIDEKLEVLFTALFEETDIPYTPELMHSCIRLTRSQYLDALLAQDEAAPVHESPREIGTREFLQKLQHGLIAMKRAVGHFCEIGKSALTLYDLHGSVLPAYL